MFLTNQGVLVPPEMAAAVRDDPSVEIKAALDAQVREEEQQRQQQAVQAVAPAPPPQQKSAPRLVAVGPDDDVPPLPDDFVPVMTQDEFELDPDATRRYTDLKFGKDYEIQ